MPDKLKVILQAPTENHWNDEADSVHIGTDAGEIEIHPGHASLVSSLGFAPVTIHANGHSERFLLRRGTLAVDPDGKTVRILAQFADKEESADAVTIEEYMQFVVDHLKNPEALSEYQVKFFKEQQSSLEKQLKILKK